MKTYWTINLSIENIIKNLNEKNINIPIYNSNGYLLNEKLYHNLSLETNKYPYKNIVIKKNLKYKIKSEIENINYINIIKQINIFYSKIKLIRNIKNNIILISVKKNIDNKKIFKFYKYNDYFLLPSKENHILRFSKNKKIIKKDFLFDINEKYIVFF